MADLSKSQVDKLGERLRDGSHSESDLRLLDEYRSSFGEAYESVLEILRKRSQSPTGRIAKTTASIIAKLRRIDVKLSRMQDIAGCRVVVANGQEQDQLVTALQTDFPVAAIVDRRDKPSHGYRAVHFIATVSGKRVEIQVRSSLQHQWAELSEKSADVLDPTIKYGGGPESWRVFLRKSSEAVASFEYFEKVHFEAEASRMKSLSAHQNFKKTVEHFEAIHLPEHVAELRDLREKLAESTRKNFHLEEESEKQRSKLAELRKFNENLLNGAISSLDKLKEKVQ